MTQPEATRPIVVRPGRRWLRGTLLGLLVLLLLLLALAAAGIFTYQHKRGFYAPVWGPDAAVYYLERETGGLVLTLDWPLLGFSSMPASSWSLVLSDTIRVQRLQPETGAVRTLKRWQETPVAGRLIQTSPAAVFGLMLATLNTHGGLSFSVNISVPNHRQALDWQQQQALFTGRGDNAIQQMRELIAVPGDGFYPAAVISTIDNQAYRVLLRNEAFAEIYPKGLGPAKLQSLSRRESIEKQAQIVARRRQLIADFKRQGLSEQAAIDKADARLAEQGYRVLAPRLVAVPVAAPEANEKVFSLAASALAAGAYADIARAVARPGMPVKKTRAPYQVESRTAAELNAWIDAGRISWIVAVDDHYYRLLLK